MWEIVEHSHSEAQRAVRIALPAPATTMRSLRRFAPQDDMNGHNGMNNYFVYILTNQYNTTFYIGVTNDLLKRVYQHKNKIFEGFTSKYNVNKLIYFEQTESIEEAIFREKQLKKYKRNKKIALITNSNPTYKDLYEEMTKN